MTDAVVTAAPGRRAVVVVASTRAADGTYEDRTTSVLTPESFARWQAGSLA